MFSGAALAIESETWKFRTRSGIYIENASDKDGSDENNIENILKNRSESIKLQVLKSAGVLNTYFMCASLCDFAVFVVVCCSVMNP